VLVKRPVGEYDDAVVGSRLAFTKLENLCFDPYCIAMEQWFWKSNFVPPQVCDRRPNRRIRNRYANHKSECQAAIYNSLPEFRLFAEFCVQV
jgi:hypothetical protein